MTERTQKMVKSLAIAMLIAYLLVLFYFVFFDNRYVSIHYDMASIEAYLRHNVNLVPFDTVKLFLDTSNNLSWESRLVNIFGNVLVFIPFGILLPLVWEKLSRYGYMLVMSFGLSFFIEINQLLLGVGSFDVDDLMLNTLGGLIGYALYRYVMKNLLSGKWIEQS